MKTTRLAVILLALSIVATPAMARSWHYGHGYRYHSGNYNFGGPRYTASDYYHNSRSLVGIR